MILNCPGYFTSFLLWQNGNAPLRSGAGAVALAVLPRAEGPGAAVHGRGQEGKYVVRRGCRGGALRRHHLDPFHPRRRPLRCSGVCALHGPGRKSVCGHWTGNQSVQRRKVEPGVPVGGRCAVVRQGSDGGSGREPLGSHLAGIPAVARNRIHALHLGGNAKRPGRLRVLRAVLTDPEIRASPPLQLYVLGRVRRPAGHDVVRLLSRGNSPL